jgi:hypothetical protein
MVKITIGLFALISLSRIECGDFSGFPADRRRNIHYSLVILMSARMILRDGQPLLQDPSDLSSRQRIQHGFVMAV